MTTPTDATRPGAPAPAPEEPGAGASPHSGAAAPGPGRGPGLLDRLAAAGLTLLGLLDRTGDVALERLAERSARRRALAARHNHLPRGAGIIGAALLALVGLGVWNVWAVTNQGDQWLTAPGAGNAELAAESSPPAPSSSTAVPAPPSVPQRELSPFLDLLAGRATVLELADALRATGLPAPSGELAPAGGTETVDGRSVAALPAADVAAVLEIPSLRLAVLLPRDPSATPLLVRFRFLPPQGGFFTWSLLSPGGTPLAEVGGTPVLEGTLATG
jgi:hypothetical protein